MGGVFAVDPVGFDVYTEVAGKSLIKIVVPDATDPETYATFDGLGINNDPVTVTNGENPLIVKKLAYFSNQKFTVDMTVAPMTGAEGNSHEIHYSATCGGTAYTSPTTGQSVEVEVIKMENTNAVTVGAKTVSVKVDKASYDNAPKDTYTGTISFTITAP